jgi:hypothetical protein
VYRFLWGGRAPRTDHTNIRGSHHEYDDENRQRSPIVTDDELKDGDFFHAANGIIEEHYFNSGVSNIIESFESAVKMVILEPGMEFNPYWVSLQDTLIEEICDSLWNHSETTRYIPNNLNGIFIPFFVPENKFA